MVNLAIDQMKSTVNKVRKMPLNLLDANINTHVAHYLFSWHLRAYLPYTGADTDMICSSNPTLTIIISARKPISTS